MRKRENTDVGKYSYANVGLKGREYYKENCKVYKTKLSKGE